MFFLVTEIIHVYIYIVSLHIYIHNFLFLTRWREKERKIRAIYIQIIRGVPLAIGNKSLFFSSCSSLGYLFCYEVVIVVNTYWHSKWAHIQEPNYILICLYASIVVESTNDCVHYNICNQKPYGKWLELLWKMIFDRLL